MPLEASEAVVGSKPKRIDETMDGQAQAIEFRVDEQTKHCGEALKDIKIRKNVLVVCITHNGKIEIPNGNSSFKKGDGIIIVTSSGDVVRQLNDIFI